MKINDTQSKRIFNVLSKELDLKDVTPDIIKYCIKSYNYISKTLKSIKKSIKNENISYGEIAELQSLKKYIDRNDIELLEWAGVPEKLIIKK